MAIFGVLTPFSGHQLFPINIIDIVATADAQRLRLTAAASACGQWSATGRTALGDEGKSEREEYECLMLRGRFVALTKKNRPRADFFELLGIYEIQYNADDNYLQLRKIILDVYSNCFSQSFLS